MVRPLKRRILRLWPLVPALGCLTVLQACRVGGSGAFVQGETPEENNAKYSGPPVTGDWVIMNLLDEPESLNPLTSTSASARYIYGYVYESFLDTRREPPYDEVPLLVESLPEVSPDHLTYTWRVRRDVRWHDGKPLTARDAEFSLKALICPYVDDLPTKPYYAELDSVNLPDDYTIVMHCSQPYFMHLEFLGGFTVIPRHIFDADGLLDGLSYFQVKHGSAFGDIAEVLDARPDLDLDLVPAAVALLRLEKSAESVTQGALRWATVTSDLPELPTLPDDLRLVRVQQYLDARPEAAPAARLARESLNSARWALSTLSPPADLSGIARPDKDAGALRVRCRDIHSRIQRFGEQFNTHPQGRSPTVGSGPYRFERWVTGQEIVLARNPDYWRGSGHAYLDKLVWRVLTDYTASLVALKNGEIDFMENLQTIQYLTMTNRRKFLDKFIKSTFVIPQYSYIGWRNSHPVFADPRVRQAMTHMVRRRDLLDKLLFGFGELVNSPFYRYGPDYDTTLVPYEYDPDRAARLLAEAGWADRNGDGILDKDSLSFRFELLVPAGSPFAEQTASVLREDLFLIGVEMNIRRLEWSVFINNYIRNHRFDACMLSWVFGIRQDPKQIWHSQSATGRGSNHVEFRNAEADSLIDAARVEFDPAKRSALYRRFQRIVHDLQPYTFMVTPKMKPAYDKRFKGVKWYPFRPGYQLDEWFVPAVEQKHR